MPCARDSYVRPGNNSEGLQVRSVLLIIDVIPNPESGVPITSTKQGVGCRLVVATATSFDATDPGSDNPVSLLLIYWPLYSGRRVTCCRTREDQIMVAIATSRRIFYGTSHLLLHFLVRLLQSTTNSPATSGWLKVPVFRTGRTPELIQKHRESRYYPVEYLFLLSTPYSVL